METPTSAVYSHDPKRHVLSVSIYTPRAMEFDIERKQQVILTVPYPPSANRYWRMARNRLYPSAEAKAYKEEVRLTNLRCKPLEGKVKLTAKVYRPRKAGDLMNREKVLCDALQGVAYLDDNQIWEAHFFMFDDKANPRVEVEITEVK